MGVNNSKSCSDVARCLNQRRTDNFPTNQTARKNLAIACRALDYYGIGRNCMMSNYACAIAKRKDGKGSCVLLVPSGALWRDVTPESLVEIDFTQEERVWDCLRRQPSLAVTIMVAVIKVRKEAMAMFHCVPLNAASLGATKSAKLENLSSYFNEIADDIAFNRSKSSDFTAVTTDWMRNCEKKHILWLASQGVSTVCESVAHAFDKLVAFEQAAEVQVRAMSTGKSLSTIPSPGLDQYFNPRKEQEENADAHLRAFRNLLPAKPQENRYSWGL